MIANMRRTSVSEYSYKFEAVVRRPHKMESTYTQTEIGGGVNTREKISENDSIAKSQQINCRFECELY